MPKDLEHHLASIVRDLGNAINQRAFESIRYPSTSLIENFSGYTGMAEWASTSSREDFAQLFKGRTEEYPSYALSCIDTNVFTHEKSGRATVFANWEIHGFPLGVVRPSVGVLEFEGLGDGKWMCMSYRCFPGLDFGMDETVARWGGVALRV